jgi:hypothetical protein
MFFPGLFDPNRRTAILSEDEKTSVYEAGIYPSLRELAPENIPNWPPAYRNATWLVGTRQGEVLAGTHPFPGHLTRELGVLISRKLAVAHRWARGLVFMTQVRGVKEAYGHNPSPFMARIELARLTESINTDEGVWFVDVGFEISGNGEAYLWRTDAHSRVLEAMVGLMPGAATRRVSPTNWSYARDINAHLLDLSGFRMPLEGNLQGDCEAKYIQIYTTDKALTYRLTRGQHSKKMSGMMALKGNPPTFVTDLFDAFNDAAIRMDVVARVEVRVPLRRATGVLLRVDDEFLRHNLVVINRDVWW